MIVLSIPLPPSANKIWRAKIGRGKPFLSPAYQAWKQEAGWIAKASRVDRVHGEFDIHVIVPKDMPGDIDNRLKAILDLCKDILTDDDRLAQDARVTRSTHVPKGMCVLKIEKSTTADAGVARPEAGLAPASIAAA